MKTHNIALILPVAAAGFFASDASAMLNVYPGSMCVALSGSGLNVTDAGGVNNTSTNRLTVLCPLITPADGGPTSASVVVHDGSPSDSVEADLICSSPFSDQKWSVNEHSGFSQVDTYIKLEGFENVGVAQGGACFLRVRLPGTYEGAGSWLISYTAVMVD